MPKIRRLRKEHASLLWLSWRLWLRKTSSTLLSLLRMHSVWVILWFDAECLEADTTHSAVVLNRSYSDKWINMEHLASKIVLLNSFLTVVLFLSFFLSSELELHKKYSIWYDSSISWKYCVCGERHLLSSWGSDTRVNNMRNSGERICLLRDRHESS